MLHNLSIDLSGSPLAGIAPVEVALVLGSGLSGVSAAIEPEVVLPFAELPGYPAVPVVAGQSGTLTIGTIEGHRVAAFSGRVHLYQDVSALEAAWPARLASALGCEVLIVTNASGGVAERLEAGDIVLISDQINLTGQSPLTGWPGPEGGTPFVSMRDAYDPDLRARAYLAASDQDITVHDGVYAQLPGPAYETPAEVAYLRAVGADVVGMSTVPEVIAARALGMRVLGFSLVTNTAAAEGLSHQEVLEMGRSAEEHFPRLLLAILRGL